ncbi:hypothetical protein [Streptomyces sp. NPDC055140]
MEIIDASSQQMAVRLTRDEAVVINNALNELCNGFDLSDDELRTRSGYTREEIRSVLGMINDAIPPLAI